MARPKIRWKYCKYEHDMDIVGRDKANRCLECGRQRLKRFRTTNLPHVRKQNQSYKRFSRHGITISMYDEMMNNQNGRCAICKNVPKEDSLKRTFHIDHCHSSGRIRGLLCKDCNHMLGFARDNPNTLIQAAEYLK